MAQSEYSEAEAITRGLEALRRFISVRAGEPPEEESYAIFLGNSPYPYDNDRYSKPGFARNSLYNKLSGMFYCGYFTTEDARRNASQADRQEYHALTQAIGYRHANTRKKFVDAAMAAGLLRIAKVSARESTSGAVAS